MPLEANHRHCKVCGRVARPGADTCSETCERERARRLGSAKTTRLALYAMIAFLAVLLVAGLLGL